MTVSETGTGGYVFGADYRISQFTTPECNPKMVMQWRILQFVDSLAMNIRGDWNLESEAHFRINQSINHTFKQILCLHLSMTSFPTLSASAFESHPITQQPNGFEVRPSSGMTV